MTEYQATEIAFKNGYKKAAEEIFEEIEKYALNIKMESVTFMALRAQVLAVLKEKYTEGKT